MEVWSRRDFEKLGIEADFVQGNQILSRPAWTLRGIHFQRGAAAQAKLVRCLQGAFFDVAVVAGQNKLPPPLRPFSADGQAQSFLRPIGG